MSTMTIANAESDYALDLLDHLDRDAQVPTITQIAPQGDVLIRRVEDIPPATTPIPATGAVVVRGENGGNTHGLYGTGFYDARTPSPTDLVVGILTVPDDATCLLSHPEHGPFLVAPGTYEARRQREQADELRLVQD